MVTTNPYTHRVEIAGPSHRGLSAIEWNDLYQTMEDWCAERFGPRLRLHSDDRQARWYSLGTNFRFIDPVHAFEFKLRWA